MGLDVLSILVVLGLAILFHEFGHFIACKIVGVRVERFSVGMGRRLIGFKMGDTDYILSAFPLGGYVKMAGDEWGKEHDEKPWEFLAQSPMRRNFIVFAGPVMNVVLAFILYYLILVGFGLTYVKTTTIGFVDHDGPAAVSEISPGDTIASIDGVPVESWTDLHGMLSESDKQAVAFDVISSTGHKRSLTVTKRDIYSDPLSDIPPVIANVIKGGAAEEVGLKTGDIILSVSGEEIETWGAVRNTVMAQWEQTNEEEYKGVPFSVSWRDNAGVVTEATLTPEIIPPEADGEPIARIGISVRFPSTYSDANYIYAIGAGPNILPVVGNIARGSPAAKAKIPEGATILTVDGKEIDNWFQLKETISSSFLTAEDGTAQGRDIEITWLAEGKISSATLTTAVTKQYQEAFSGEKTATAYVGISPRLDKMHPGIFKSFWLAMQTLFKNCLMFVTVLYRLVARQISPKVIGGPIQIMKMAAEFGRREMSGFLSFMAMINLNLAVVNLLPIPILDGGHILFYSIESVRKKRFTVRQMEVATYIGLAILLPLIVWVFYNDLSGINWAGFLAKFGISGP